MTPNYPGLEGATSALMRLTGLSSYGAGIVIVGAARLSLMVALFLLFTRISGSARTAGLGAAIYAGNFNFLFWGAQFSYESLALPLFVVVLMAVAEREAAPREWAREWAVPIVLGIAAIVVTHHLTSYAVAVFLAAARARLLVRAARLELAQPLALRRLRRGPGGRLAGAGRQLDLRLPRRRCSAKPSKRSSTPPPARRRRAASSRARARASRRRRCSPAAVALLAVALLAAGVSFGLRALLAALPQAALRR